MLGGESQALAKAVRKWSPSPTLPLLIEETNSFVDVGGLVSASGSQLFAIPSVGWFFCQRTRESLKTVFWGNKTATNSDVVDVCS